ncbi:TPA-induced transmembrane protein isoform X2 [Anoplopoma fimbria]|uniref:TPA-induced transmembrane protein isoform X2 n=1 Tax=Anoplopoma fimbria TaxID=229290 RepID=UPI0023ED140A|nr:TPA-induced transmembrane protein isoform X2 [Anoplopoma fimbria]
MDIELQPIGENGNDGAAYSFNERARAGNGDGPYRIPDATESDGLLSAQISSVCKIRRKRLRLWGIIVLIVLLIIAVVFISLAVCAAVHKDVDENFDSSLFKVPRSFNGSFQMPNQVFTEELFSISSNESQELAANLTEKLADLYRSSPALGRYFSKAEIQAFRNGSVIADYQLTFLMPEEQQDQLRNTTLSREMVFNVFRQFLYDQEGDESGQTYIDPVSLNMFLRH